MIKSVKLKRIQGDKSWKKTEHGRGKSVILEPDAVRQIAQNEPDNTIFLATFSVMSSPLQTWDYDFKKND